MAPSPIVTLYPGSGFDPALQRALKRNIVHATMHRLEQYSFQHGGWPWTVYGIRVEVERAAVGGSSSPARLAAAFALTTELGLLAFLPLKRRIQRLWFIVIGRL